MRSLLTYGRVVRCAPRELIDRRRMYNASTRYTLYYPSFGVYKHVRWGKPMPGCNRRFNCTRLKANSVRSFQGEASCPAAPKPQWCHHEGTRARC